MAIFRSVSILGLARSPTSDVGDLQKNLNVSILGLARSPTSSTPGPFWGQGVSILGLARSPTNRPAKRLKRSICFNTWAREEPNPANNSQNASSDCFNTWAREEPNIFPMSATYSAICFNTWAREEPNRSETIVPSFSSVSILGLARSPTQTSRDCGSEDRFQYLGSRGAQLWLHTHHNRNTGFNTWAREEPNANRYDTSNILIVSILGLARSPTKLGFQVKKSPVVSILGLARSPTSVPGWFDRAKDVSILGLARSPTSAATAFRSAAMVCFNTWAREEPNPCLPYSPQPK